MEVMLDTNVTLTMTLRQVSILSALASSIVPVLALHIINDPALSQEHVQMITVEEFNELASELTDAVRSVL